MKKRIYLSPPDVDDLDMQSTISAFKSNWIAPLGPEVDNFETELAHFLNVDSVAVLTSGTAALHLSLILSNVGPGDIVFCPSFTFAASAFPIKYLKAEPVFIESEQETWNISPEFLDAALQKYHKLGKLPKAVICVDLYGMPAKYDEITALCEKYNVLLIEDAAEALGSSYNNKMLGSFGHFGILSFNGNKIITTSGGGALTCSDSRLVEKSRFLASQAREKTPHYEHKEIGYNYRMSNLLAGLGRSQLRRIQDKVSKRRSIFEQYKALLGDISELSFTQEPEGSFSNRWLTTIIFDERAFSSDTNNRIRIALEKENIETRPLWKPLHTQPIFHQCDYIGDKTSEKLFDYGLCLPSGTSLEEEEQLYIVELIKKHL